MPTPHAGNYEPFYFHQPDVGFPVFETAYGRIGIYICYDRHFPEIARIYGVKGAEIVFNPSATGGPSRSRCGSSSSRRTRWRTATSSAP